MKKNSHLQQRIEIHLGDITKLAVDAIVNAANRSLMGGGGVDGAIHRAGGPIILEECRKIVASRGPCETGQAVITSAGKLPARHVIHTVGPIWQGGHLQERSLLAGCYKNSLVLASEFKCRSISFPNISTGIYGFPKPEAVMVSLDAVIDFLQHGSGIEKVLFVCFDNQNYQLLQAYWEKLKTEQG